MADGAFTCACQNHVTPGSVPPAGVCGWLEKFGKSCASCPGAATGRRLSTVPSAAAADGLSYGYSAFESRNSTPGTAMNITLQQQQQRRHLTSLLPVNPGLPPGSKCKDYSPERLCAAQPETWSKDPLYMVYTMWSVCEWQALFGFRCYPQLASLCLVMQWHAMPLFVCLPACTVLHTHAQPASNYTSDCPTNCYTSGRQTNCYTAVLNRLVCTVWPNTGPIVHACMPCLISAFFLLAVKCRNRWQQTSRSGTSTSMFDAVCGCNPDVNSTLWSGAT
jgi:hypothetical protein